MASSWEWEFYLPGLDWLRAIHCGRNIWCPGGRGKYLSARLGLIRDKWGNCDKISAPVTHHITFLTPSRSRDLCPCHARGPSAQYPQNLTPNWSHISPGIIPAILSTSLTSTGWKLLKLTKWAASEARMMSFLVSVTADSFNRILTSSSSFILSSGSRQRIGFYFHPFTARRLLLRSVSDCEVNFNNDVPSEILRWILINP